MSTTKKPESEKPKVQKDKPEAMSGAQVPKDTIADVKRAPDNAEKIQEGSLPAGVTVEPQDPEHMSLDLIKDSPDLLRPYLNVSDDKGQLLGDANLENKVITFCNQYKNADFKKMGNLVQLLEEAKALGTNYGKQINIVENTLGGITCKYRIREGMIFNIQKSLTDEIGLIWKKWFKSNYNPNHFRSVSDYMRLAKIPNVIRYSVYGKERLLQIERQLGDYAGKEDPISDFLRDNNVDFDVYAETDPKELKIQTDIVINYKKLEKEGLDVIPVEKVEALVRNGKDLMPKHISDLKFLKDHNGNYLSHMDQIIASDGSPEPIMTPEKKAKSFKGVVDRFIKAAESAFVDSEYLGEIDEQFFAQLKQKVLELEQRVITSN